MADVCPDCPKCSDQVAGLRGVDARFTPRFLVSACDIPREEVVDSDALTAGQQPLERLRQPRLASGRDDSASHELAAPGDAAVCEDLTPGSRASTIAGNYAK